MENDQIDNIPGEMNPHKPLGNYVVIDHNNGEFSFLVHFKKNSILVAVGDTVTQGQTLGQCGNSGNTSEPHIHYHLQTTGEYGKGEGLPAQFINYNKNGTAVERGELEQGQLIRPQ